MVGCSCRPPRPRSSSAAAEQASLAKDEAAREHAELTGQLRVWMKTREGRDLEAKPMHVLERPAPPDDAAPPAGEDTTIPPAAPGRCNVPLSIARERGCPLAVEAPPPVAAARLVRPVEARAASDEVDDSKYSGDLDEEIAATRAAIERAAATLQERRAASSEIDAKLAEITARAASKEAAVREAEELLKEARAAEREASGVEERRRDRAARMADVSEKRASLRRTHHESLVLLSERFDSVLRALLGDQVKGRVEVTRDGIEPVAIAQGDRESAALDTIKVLAFDMAALSLGFEGHGHFPGFLVHDGPREADMDQAVYDRLFLYAQQMEEAFSPDGSIGFQYIVTTTTPPPERLRRAPWLLDPVLDASVEEGRLLRMNL